MLPLRGKRIDQILAGRRRAKVLAFAAPAGRVAQHDVNYVV
jgi:hypothetical protein